MDKWNLFQRYLITENAQISILDFIINALIILVLSLTLEFTYSRCAKSLSNRKAFGANFLFNCLYNHVDISIVKSSLALSLGLVGALSIVRFRSAIKEPGRVGLFVFYHCNRIGTWSNSADNYSYWVRCSFSHYLVEIFEFPKSRKQNLYLTISSTGEGKPNLKGIDSEVLGIFKSSKLVRYDESSDLIEAAYWVEVNKSDDLQQFKDKLNNLCPGIRVRLSIIIHFNRCRDIPN